jgi:antitoxin MazE
MERVPTVKVSKGGNSLVIRIPRTVAKDARIAEGDRLSLELADDGSIVLRSTKCKFRLDQLVSKITPKNRHKATAWGGAGWSRSRVNAAGQVWACAGLSNYDSCESVSL